MLGGSGYATLVAAALLFVGIRSGMSVSRHYLVVRGLAAVEVVVVMKVQAPFPRRFA